jgi:hypothetical protein
MAIPVAIGYIYYFNFQTYVLVFDLCFNIIGLVFLTFEIIFSLFSILYLKSYEN